MNFLTQKTRLANHQFGFFLHTGSFFLTSPNVIHIFFYPNLQTFTSARPLNINSLRIIARNFYDFASDQTESFPFVFIMYSLTNSANRREITYQYYTT